MAVGFEGSIISGVFAWIFSKAGIAPESKKGRTRKIMEVVAVLLKENRKMAMKCQ